MIKIGLSLGGGSLRGIAHIGVLKELEKYSMPISYIAGTSSGALIGGLYACGYSPARLQNLFENLNWYRYIDIRLPKYAILKGKKVYSDLLKMTEGRTFADLDIPFAVTSVDIVSGQLHIINTGELANAIRASIALPGIFHPVYEGDKILVDGYILNNNPADIVRKMGADFVIASEVKSKNNHLPVTGLVTCLQRYMDIASIHQTNTQLLKYADLVIRVKGNDTYKWPFIGNIADLIAAGSTETAKALATLNALSKFSASD